MAAEKDLPASIVDRVRSALSKMGAPDEAYTPDAAPAAPAEESLAAGSEARGSETEG
jgi:hypothetical protein